MPKNNGRVFKYLKPINDNFWASEYLCVDSTEVGTVLPSFPLYVSPRPEGVRLLIRKGKPHLVDRYAPVMHNLHFKEKFLELIRLSFDKEITIDCTLSHKALDTQVIYNALKSTNVKCKIPAGSELYINDVVFERVSGMLNVEERMQLIDSLVLKVVKQNNSLRYKKPVLVKNTGELDRALVFLAQSSPLAKEAVIAKPSSRYDASKPDNLEEVLCVLKTAHKSTINSMELLHIQREGKIVPMVKTLKVNMDMRNNKMFDNKNLIIPITIPVDKLSIPERVALAQHAADLDDMIVIWEGIATSKTVVPMWRQLKYFDY